MLVPMVVGLPFFPRTTWSFCYFVSGYAEDPRLPGFSFLREVVIRRPSCLGFSTLLCSSFFVRRLSFFDLQWVVSDRPLFSASGWSSFPFFHGKGSRKTFLPHDGDVRRNGPSSVLENRFRTRCYRPGFFLPSSTWRQVRLLLFCLFSLVVLP